MSDFNTQQTYSGSYDFSPSVGSIILNAFDRIQVRPTEITAPHLQRAVMELNLLQSRVSNSQPNLWTVDLQTLPLTEGDATYSLPAETVMIQNGYIRVGTDTTDERMIFPISQTEYSAISNKSVEGSPTQFWYNRVISQTITFYPVPDGNGPYTFYYYRVKQQQDALPQNGYNLDAPFRFYDYFVAGLAHRLARIYRPDLEMLRKADADEAWDIAAKQDTENVNMIIAPGLSGYYR